VEVREDNIEPAVLAKACPPLVWRACQFFTRQLCGGSKANLLKKKKSQKSDSRVGRVNARGNSRVIEHREKHNKGYHKDHA
jgi:hypothetical protein